MNLIMPSLFVLLGLYFGARIYSVLGGIDDFFISFVWVLIGVVAIYSTYKVGEAHYNHANYGTQKARYRGGTCLWFIIVCFISPVLINALAVSMKWLGYEVAHAYVLEFRFWGMLFIPIMCITLYRLIRWLIFRCKRFRERLGVGIVERGTL